MKTTYYTKEGLQELKDRLDKLQEALVGGAEEVKRARAFGDLKENAEYHAARAHQAHVRHEIGRVKKMLGNAVVLDASEMDTSRVSVLTKVKLKQVKLGTVHVYQLVAEAEADLKMGKLSIISPVGHALLGKQVGDLATIKTPAGEVAFEVLEIST